MKRKTIWFPNVSPEQLEELERLADNLGLAHDRPADVVSIILASWPIERLGRELRAALRKHGMSRAKATAATRPVAVPMIK